MGRKAYLWPDEVDVLVCAENAAVITDVAMATSHTKINQHILTDGIADDLSKDFPAVEESITWQAVSSYSYLQATSRKARQNLVVSTFKVVIKTSIARNLQLWAGSE